MKNGSSHFILQDECAARLDKTVREHAVTLRNKGEVISSLLVSSHTFKCVLKVWVTITFGGYDEALSKRTHLGFICSCLSQANLLWYIYIKLIYSNLI